MRVFDIVGLTPLLERTRGRPEIVVGLIDGPVALDHPDLAGQRIREIAGVIPAVCANRDSAACAHGTFVAGILAGKRGSKAPAICPDCTLLVRPIFSETNPRDGVVPAATSEELAVAIIDCIQAGARILNLSVNFSGFSGGGESDLAEALSFAARRGVIPVVAAANQGAVVNSALTRHAWALPVMACDHRGRPLQGSNLSAPLGRRGIVAPGKEITSLGTNGKPLTASGTSAATAFVTGAIALLWSELPRVKTADMKFAMTNRPGQRPGLVPPMLNAWTTYQALTGGARLSH
jgi:subtilisin family serine protease